MPKCSAAFAGNNCGCYKGAGTENPCSVAAAAKAGWENPGDCWAGEGRGVTLTRAGSAEKRRAWVRVLCPTATTSNSELAARHLERVCRYKDSVARAVRAGHKSGGSQKAAEALLSKLRSPATAAAPPLPLCSGLTLARGAAEPTSFHHQVELAASGAISVPSAASGRAASDNKHKCATGCFLCYLTPAASWPAGGAEDGATGRGESCGGAAVRAALAESAVITEEFRTEITVCGCHLHRAEWQLSGATLVPRPGFEPMPRGPREFVPLTGANAFSCSPSSEARLTRQRHSSSGPATAVVPHSLAADRINAAAAAKTRFVAGVETRALAPAARHFLRQSRRAVFCAD